MSLSTVALAPQQARPAGSALRILALVALAMPVSAMSLRATQSSPPMAVASGAHPSAADALARLPIRFEPNRGQAPAGVLYTVRGAGYTAALGATGMALTFPGQTRAGAAPAATVLGMALVGATARAHDQALDRLSGTSTYLVGPRSAWRTGVPNYGRVRMQQVYPGIDLSYYGAGRQLEYTFTLAPGANPSAIRLAFSKNATPALDAHGNLLLRAAGGTLMQRAPIAYQAGPRGRVAVAAHFALRGRQVGFRLGAYNLRLPLTIDPVIAYSTFLGGSSFGVGGGDGLDQGNAIAEDAAGNLYVTGLTYSLDFPTLHAGQPFNNGWAPVGIVTAFPASNAFVTKIAPTGALVFSTYLGGCGNFFSQGDSGDGIAVDAAGNIYIDGQAYSGSGFGGPSCAFPTTASAFQTDNNDLNPFTTGSNAFLTKLSGDGQSLLYSTYLGGSDPAGNGDEATAVAVDGSGNAYLTGIAYSADFPTAGTPKQPANNDAAAAGANAFVAKVNTNASGAASLVYSTFLGGSDACGDGDGGLGIALDTGLNAYVTGFASSPDFPTTPGALQSVNGATDQTCATYGSVAFVTKVNPTGSDWVYSTLLGGSRTAADASGSFPDVGTGIAVDSLGEAFVSGVAYLSNFPTTPGAFQRVNKDYPLGPNAVVARLSASGNSLVYGTYLGGSDPLGDGDGAMAIAIDATGAAVVTGFARSADFPVTASAPQPTVGAGVPSLAAAARPARPRFAANRPKVTFSAPAISAKVRAAGPKIFPADKYRLVHLGRHIRSQASRALAAAPTDNYDAFVTKLQPSGHSLIYSTFLGGHLNDQGNGVAIGADGNAAVTGFTYSGNFPITPATAVEDVINDGAGENGVTDDAFVTVLEPSGCFFAGTVSGGGQRLGIARVGPTTGPQVGTGVANIFYVTFQSGASTFVIRTPDSVSCNLRPGTTASVTVTATLGVLGNSIRGSFASGQKVQIVVSQPLGANASATVTNLTTGAIYTVAGGFGSTPTLFTN